ncbi:probable leucine--tRNA ligase, mitochondrial [Mercenaria mercenaria]|uniref:probable leucine--tRNA ligase, mitochondrial n=1 Tax=Mercenaria mercenaria TaxID=6596 RepID=UPI00234E63F8|nr:probable leucine--tRNA ligase, mitochondrial [Mercenaria mercenaria]XP_053402025.1 probable leucine--tRNA ligase, mitochondrial [Mercenaria mercenaria]
MKLLNSVPNVTWSVLKHTLINVQQLRNLCVPASLYEKTGKWAFRLNKEQILEIEEIWKERLHKYDIQKNCEQTEGEGEKFYVLSMFPYPSGKLHMGHVRVYTISDVVARYHRMLGHKVIHPMGWDAFGLPAENAAIERDLHPRDWTYSNISTMKEQLKNLCCAFDWEREVTTCDPSYYKWTQYIFLKMYEAGLVYQKQAIVNWDPIDETVLADEQVDEEGHSWRSGAKVEQRYLKQWYIKTTAYAQSLLDGLHTVRSDLWKNVINMQKTWIGECTGCRLDFALKWDGEDFEEPISVFTDIPEAVFGISHVALSTSHRYNQEKYYCKKVESSDAQGEILLNIQAIHPLTGETVPVVVSKMSEESMESNDSLLGIPCESETDRKVADMHGFSWRQVFSGASDNQVLVNSHPIVDGLKRKDAAEKIMSTARDKGIGGDPMSSHLKDWLISRQRYWGTPIPVIHCDKCKAVPVPLEDLPVVLPDATKPSVGKGRSVLEQDVQWLNVKCPKCGGPAKRETDTMDTFVDSSWYFLRYLDHANEDVPVSREMAEKNMPVDLYIGGLEHALLHLYYARFFSHFLCDQGMSCHREPFVNLLTQGMVKGESYRVQKTGMYLKPSEVEKVDGKYVQKGTGEKLIVKYEKMSKSKHNGIDPEELFKEFGADMTRLCILSNVTPQSDRNWNNDVFAGVQKWLHRVWTLVGVLVETPNIEQPATQEHITEWDRRIKAFRNKYLLEIRYSLNKTFMFNTAISRMHEITSLLKKVPVEVACESKEYEGTVKDLVTMIAPFAPMFSSECWAGLKQPGHVLDQKWPEVDADTPLKLNVFCNDNQIGIIEMEPSELKKLTKSVALTLSQQQPFYRDKIGEHKLEGISLAVNEDWNAIFMLDVPSLLDEKEQKKNKKGKKNKKLVWFADF